MARQKPAEAKADRIPLVVAAVVSLALIAAFSFENFFPGAPQLFFPLDQKWIDQEFRWRGLEKGDPRISIVTIDDDSIKAIGQYPWPRHVYAELLDKFWAAGVKVAGLDILFLDRSTPQEDAAFVAAARKAGRKLVLAVGQDLSDPMKYSYRKPFPALKEAGNNFGAVDQIIVDNDGVVRRTCLMYGRNLFDKLNWPADPDRMPAFGLTVLSVFEGKRPDDYMAGRKNLFRLNIRGQKGGQLQKSEEGSRGLIYHRVLFGFRRVKAMNVLGGNLSPEEREALNGGIVLVGSTALGAFDHFPNPFTDSAPGVEVHANLIDNLMGGRDLKDTPLGVTLLLILSFGFLAAFAIDLGPLLSASAVLGLFFGWIGISYWEFLRLRILDFTAPAAALLVPYAILLVRKTLLENLEKRRIQQTFGQFVAPEVVEDLVKDPSRAKLGGEKRDMTVFFLDVAHFTTISEKMEAEALMKFLNKYLSAFSQVIHSHKGVVDKYIGDCVMAFWNAPLEQPEHRALACLAAVECQEIVEKLNADLGSTLPERPAVRIGLNSGVMNVGFTGSEKKLQYTVIGDEVNLASRLEGANKFFGSKIMVSESCYDGAKDKVEGRVLGKVRVVGKSIPIKVYELLGKKGALPGAWPRALAHYEKGVELFVKGDFAGSKKELDEVMKLVPGDAPTKTYLNMLEDYLAIPPQAGWDVFNLTAK